jgi:hypothetical protein
MGVELGSILRVVRMVVRKLKRELQVAVEEAVI